MNATNPALQPISSAPDTLLSPLLQLKDVVKQYHVSTGPFSRPRLLTAVDHVSLSIAPGETLGLVGESGCGKSTLSKIILGLLASDSGQIMFDGQPISDIPRKQLVRLVQPVFQNPFSALNPSRTVMQLVRQPLQINGLDDENGQLPRRMLDAVGLPERLASAYIRELSGGQRQRVAIARALVVKPRLLICDEPTSALDVSVQAQIVNLLLELRTEMQLTILFISHDLAVVEHLANRVAVMYLGEIVEQSAASNLFAQPRHPYTQALLAATLAPVAGSRLIPLPLGNAAADPFSQMPGCRLASRCPMSVSECKTDRPALLGDQQSSVRCFRASPAAAPQ